MGRHQVMKDDHCGCFEVGRASECVPGRSLPVVVAVNERERPSGARFAQTDAGRGARFGDEDRRRGSASPADRLLEFAPPVRLRKQRFDDMERRNAGGDEMDGRPTAPRADLDSAPPPERARVAIEDRSFVAIDEPDRRIASVDPKRMVDLLAKIGPSRGALVRLDHVRKEMIENRRFKIGSYVVLGHDGVSSKGTKRPEPAFKFDLIRGAYGAAGAEAMACRAIGGQGRRISAKP